MSLRPFPASAPLSLVFLLLMSSFACSSDEEQGPILRVVIQYDANAGLERLQIGGRFDDNTGAFAPGFVPQTPTALTSGSETIDILMPQSAIGRAVLLRVDGESGGALAVTGFTQLSTISADVTDAVVVLEDAYVQCGDGVIVEPLERCDDGNDSGGDGCGAGCLVEEGFVCETLPSGTSSCMPEQVVPVDEPLVELTASTVTVEEGTGLGVAVRVRLPEGESSLTDAVSASLTVSGSAGSEDFSAPGSLDVVFAVGTEDGAIQNFTFAITTDGLIEGDETLVVTLGNPVNAALGTFDELSATVIDAESATVGFEKVAPRAGEDDGTAALRVALTPDPPTATLASDVTVALSDRGTGSAVPGTDYEAFDTTVVTFPAGTSGESIQSVPVTLLGDTTVESEKTIDFGLGAPTGPAALGANAATLTVVDDDSVAISFVSDTFSVAEDGGSVSVQVQLTIPGGGVLPRAASVLVEVISGTAGVGTDFQVPSASTRSLTFPLGSDDGAQQAIQIAVADDAFYEDVEDFTVRLALPSDAVIGVRGEATVEIVDNETAAYAFAQSSSNVDEDGSALIVPVTLVLDAGVSLAVPLSFRVTDSGRGSAAVSADYAVTGAGNLTFGPGSVNGARVDLTVTPSDNSVVDGTRTVILELTGPLSQEPREHVVSIVDDDNASISFATPNQRVVEGVGTVSVDLTLNVPGGGGLLAPAEVVLEVAGGTTASDPDDFTTGSLTLNFNTGALDDEVQSIELTVVDDALVENDESIVLRVASATGLTAGSGTSTVVIEDNETASVGFTLSSSMVVESSGTPLDIDVRLDLGPGAGTETTEPVVVTIIDTLEGDANPGTDYTFSPSSQMLTFPAGSVDGASQTVTLTPIDDAILEGAKTVVLRASASGAALGVSDHEVTIVEDDSATLEFSASAVSVSEADGSVTASVVLSVPGGGDLVAPVSAQVLVAGGGSAAAGSDFTAPADAMVTFDAGTSSGASRSVTFTLQNDTLFEGDESFTLQLGGLSNALAGATNTLTATIQDNESGTVGFAFDSSTASESDGPQSIDIVLDFDSAGTTLASPVTVNVSVAAGSTAVDGSDYTITSSLSFTFPAGSGDGDIQQVVVDPIDDIDVGLSVELILTITATGAPLGEASHTLGLVDDDTASVSLSAGSGSVDESDDATVQVDLRIPGGGTLVSSASVELTLVEESIVDGDYSGPSSWTVTFAPGSGDGDSDSITVPIVDDRLYEGDETFRIDLSAPTGISLGGTTSQRVTVVDNESALVAFRATGSSIDEDDTDVLAVAFFLTLDADSTAIPIEVTVQDTGTGSAQSGSDFNVVGGLSRTFPSGSLDDAEESIELEAIDDTSLQGDRTIVFGLSSSDATADSGTHTVTLIEDDAATVTFDPPNLNAGENAGTVQATVRLSVPSAGSLPTAESVQVELLGGTATVDDFAFSSPQTLSFLASDPDGTTLTVDISIDEDALLEADETVILRLFNPSSGLAVGGAGSEFTLLIQDND